MNASKFGSIGDEIIGLPNDISIKSCSISFPFGNHFLIQVKKLLLTSSPYNW